MDIQWHVVTDLNADLREAAEARILKLKEGQKDLIHIVVNVEGSKHHQHGNAKVKIRCQAKGRELIVQEKDDEPEIALNRAVDVFEREVRKLRSKRRDHRVGRGSVPAPQEEEAGGDYQIAEGAD